MSKSKFVLLVEDDQDIRELISEIFETEGIELKTACNGEQGINLLQGNTDKPKLILLDLMMPKTDGVWFCNERDKFPQLKDIPIVILSADGRAGVKVSNLSVQGILKKPLGIDELIQTVRNYL